MQTTSPIAVPPRPPDGRGSEINLVGQVVSWPLRLSGNLGYRSTELTIGRDMIIVWGGNLLLVVVVVWLLKNRKP